MQQQADLETRLRPDPAEPAEDRIGDYRYRRWREGCYERLLPETAEHLKPAMASDATERQRNDREENHRRARLSRIERCAEQIKAGAHRDLCRAFVAAEDEWREAIRRTGFEPGDA